MRFLAIFLLILFLPGCLGGTKEEKRGDEIVIIYDNRGFGELEGSWGFSALIRFHNYTILFDTGGNGRILLNNMRKLGIDPNEIQYVFLSHIHGDHTGGLWDFLEENSNVTVFLPVSFPENFKENIKARGAKVVPISKPVEILPDVYSTGEMFPVGEQSIILNTSKGIVIITGCSHPGVVRIVERAENITKKKPYLVLGGFHLFGANKTEIKEISKKLKSLGVQRIMPCHCSGDEARKIFAKEFGANYIDCRLGKKIEI
ncbi:MBL fold metallo-hydrolase [Thermococci archaeon]|nr:MAG: MBL fold metallo-hydrolase [Thermococci archaeon]